MARKAAGTPATVLLTSEKIAHDLHPYVVSADAPNYGALVADALCVAPERVFKTLIAEVDGALTVVVVPVTGGSGSEVARRGGRRKAGGPGRPGGRRAQQRLRPRRYQPARAAQAAADGGGRLGAGAGADVRLGGAARPAGVAGPGRPDQIDGRNHGQYSDITPDRVANLFPLRHRYGARRSFPAVPASWDLGVT